MRTGGGPGSITGTEKDVCTQASPLYVSRKQAVPAHWTHSEAPPPGAAHIAGADKLLAPQGLPALGLDDVTQSAQHLHPGASETHCPTHSDALGANPGQAQVGPGDKGPPPPNPLQVKPVPSSKCSQSLRGRCSPAEGSEPAPSSAILSTQSLGLQEDALHGRDPLLVLDVEGLELRVGRDSGVTGRLGAIGGPSGAPWSPASSLWFSPVQSSLRVDTPGAPSPGLFPGWA